MTVVQAPRVQPGKSQLYTNPAGIYLVICVFFLLSTPLAVYFVYSIIALDLLDQKYKNVRKTTART